MTKLEFIMMCEISILDKNKSALNENNSVLDKTFSQW